jgi:hypothetical protein
MIKDNWQHFANEWSKLIARAWLDNEYRESFIADPKSRFHEAGLTLPDIVDVQVDLSSDRWRIEPSSDFNRIIFTIALPPRPTQLTEERLSLAQREGFPCEYPIAEAAFLFTGLHCHI